MWALASESRREELGKATPAQQEARNRMALFPIAKGGHGGDGQGGPRSEVIFVQPDKWVPVVRLDSKVRRQSGATVRSLAVRLMTALHLSWNPESVSATVDRPHTVFATTPCFIKTVPPSHLHRVSSTVHWTRWNLADE